MSRRKNYSDDPSILEAVDNLSSMAELEVEEARVEKKESTDETIRLNVNKWLDPRNEQKSLDSAKNTFKAVQKYLEHVYAKEGKSLKDIEMQKGVRSIIALANEAAFKLDQCRAVFGDKTSVTQTKEFRDLIEFYEKKILKRFEEVIQSEEEWGEEWGGEEDAADIQRRGLKDLESVTRDRDYELFHLTKEDGTRFYNRNLIRHIRLVADFDQLVSSVDGDDPLLKVRLVQDKEAQRASKSIYEHLGNDLDRWIRRAGKFREDPLVQTFFRAIMALLLSANKYNTIMQTSCKPSIAYFADFQYYLRATLYNVDYLSIIENPPEETDPFYENMIEVIHKTCYQLFVHKEDSSDALSLFVKILGLSDVPASEKSVRSSLSTWNEVLDHHEALHGELTKFPSGPLFKVLDIIHEGPPEDFDPYMNDDRPAERFNLHFGKSHIQVITMGCPTRQAFVHKAEVIPEFVGFLRHMKKHSQKALVINFQDRTSWKEFARCSALEALHATAEFRFEIDIVTFPKDTDFTEQSDTYLKLNNAEEFKQNLLEQFKSEEECGFHFPKYFKRDELHEFANICIDTIHSTFFGKKDILSRKNRLDFIELFTQILIYKFLVVSQATHLFYTAKDGIDIPAVAAATTFALSKILGGSSDWHEEEKESYSSYIFLPALLVRERAVDLRLLSRSVSMLSVVSAELEVSRPQVQKALNMLLGTSFCEKLLVDFKH